MQIIGMGILVILASFYFFPFEFTFLPGINTKMAMAGFGLILLAVQLTRQQKSVINKDIFIISLFAGVVSLVGLVSVVVNGTADYNYASYIISMWVWASAAYVVVHFINVVHGGVSVKLVCNYLIVVCVVQCMLAYAMGVYAPLKNFAGSFVLDAVGFLGDSSDRLYGIGASLDIAGTRFAAVLIMIACLLKNAATISRQKDITLYMAAFFIIVIFGNMISRTTSVGLIFALLYFTYVCLILGEYSNMGYVFRWLLGIGVVLLPILFYNYYTNMTFHNNIRFAFEGFFSLWETGKWETNSNEILKNMYVFPDNMKTWIIGDGYFDYPYLTDSYYTGHAWKWGYHDTDVGYSRFIFYFGMSGLVAFSIFFCKVSEICTKRFPDYAIMFFLFLLLNFVVWLKVSTDIFLVFALFLFVDREQRQNKNALK